MKLVAISLIAAMAFVATAQAAEKQVVVAGTDPTTVHSKLLAAADRLCQQARANDPFDDFGSQQECIENTLDGVHVKHRVYQPVYSQSQTKTTR